MITLEQAIVIIRESSYTLGTERVELNESLNRVLREDIASDLDMPPFDKSAVDGYACRREDIKRDLRIVETIHAGTSPRRRIEKDECAKIMTGATMPGGADCVLLREEVVELSGQSIRFRSDSTATNVCFKGEDVVVGQKLVSAGIRISPAQVATLALAGYSQPLVSLMPRVGIVATGDEIVEPSERPGLSKIRNSNSYQLLAHAKEFGCRTQYYGIVRDTNESILSVIKKAEEENDVLLLTGGVSAGDLDLVPDILEHSGYEVLFRGVGIQPGRPTLYARSGRAYVFGLPGSPVASFIVFEVLVKEFLAGLMGLWNYVRTSRCLLAADVKREKSRRIGWRPVKVTADGKAVPVEYHGTAHISSYAIADGVIFLPIDCRELKEGSLVDVRMF